MAKIVTYPSDILKTNCTPVEPGSSVAHHLQRELRATMHAGRAQGIGLAAPQIGITLRAFAMDTRFLKLKCPDVFFNPEVIEESPEVDVEEESCLSFPPKVKVRVQRRKRVRVKACDVNGKDFEIDLVGLAARCALHEIDHLNGKTILDHAGKKEKNRILGEIAVDIKRGRK